MWSVHMQQVQIKEIRSQKLKGEREVLPIVTMGIQQFLDSIILI